MKSFHGGSVGNARECSLKSRIGEVSLEDLIGCDVDVVTEAAISPYIREEVLREAVSL
jgi:predicted nucleotidyltransferase